VRRQGIALALASLAVVASVARAVPPAAAQSAAPARPGPPAQPTAPARPAAAPPRIAAAAPGVAPLPPAPPPPDVAPLVPWAAAPLDKPAIELTALALPPAPTGMPVVAPVPVALPLAPKPMETLPSPRALPCVGAWLRIPAESLECGRARLARGEVDEAARALEQAARAGAEPHVLVEARYWYGEALYQLGQIERADWLFRQVVIDRTRADLTPWALFGSGITALRLGDAARAEDALRRVLAAVHPVTLDMWARHALGLALYAQGRWADADKVWADATARRLPTPLDREVLLWHGDALGRLGQAPAGVEKLGRFTQGGPHPLLAPGLVRLGWWSLAAGAPAEALKALRAGLAAAPTAGEGAREREWAEAGVAAALIGAADWAGARAALASLDGRRSSLAVPVRLRLLAAAVEAGQAGPALATAQELLGSNLSPALRGWVLLAKGDAHRAEGNADEARTQYDLARGAGASPEVARHAVLRLAQTNFGLREFAQAVADVRPLLTAPVSPEMRAAALLVQGEAAYQANNWTAAADAYRRVLVEFPTQRQAPAVRLAMAWTALRQGQRDDALRQFLEFARAHPADAHAVDALVLASELQLSAGDLAAARTLLDQIVSAHAGHPRAELARFNRALLMLRTGQPALAERELAAWIGRVPQPALMGRAHAALGAALLAQGRSGDAAREFARAQREGVSDLGALGLGSAALMERRLDEAARELTQARDTGTAPIVAAAEYGLAVVAFHRGQPAEFKKAARATLDAASRTPSAPRLLYALVAVAADERDWPGGLAMARRLAAEFPADEAADDGLERIGAAAAGAGAWLVARDAYTLLRQRYPQSPFVETSRQAFGQALLETNQAREARQVLEPLAAAPPADAGAAARTWLLLARARDAAGDAAGALDAFSRAAQGGDAAAWPKDAMLAHARLLAAGRRWDEARTVLTRVLRQADGVEAGEAALALGDTWARQGDALGAAEYYLTAAYLVPDSPVARRALLSAARTLAAAREADAAATLYRKLLAQAGVPADVAAEARRGLADLKR